MPHVLIIHEVEAYPSWKTIFDQAAGIRKTAGEISYQLLRYDTNSNRIVHFSEWSSLEQERAGEVAINLDLVREAHLGGGLLHLYFERSSSAQDDMTFTGENAQKIWAAMG